jgi:hypothetical protein
MRKPQDIFLLGIVIVAATWVIFLACIGPSLLTFGPGLGPRECADIGGPINSRVVMPRAPRASYLDVVGVPYAKIEMISTQTQFDCPNASGAGRMVFVADQEGRLKGIVSHAVEDEFRLTIAAEGCQSLVYDAADVRFMEQGNFILNCDSPPSIPSPPPTPTVECKTIEGDVDWRIHVNGEPFQGFALVAQIEISSVQNTFTCANGYPLQALWFATDRFGEAIDKISGHAEDIVRVRITAPGCQPFEEEISLATLLVPKQTYTIACDLSQLTPRPTPVYGIIPTITPSPTPQ